MVCARRGGCAAALELLKKVAEKGPWAGVLQDALDWVCPEASPWPAAAQSASNLSTRCFPKIPRSEAFGH
jgi:hypothetical protein